MAKYWAAGQVKTRLGADVGNPVSAELHRRFVLHLCAHLASTADRRELVVAPPEAIDTMAACTPNSWRFRAQSQGDLGDRMSSWFVDVMDETDDGRAVLIGADCPLLKHKDMAEAFELLGSHDTVLGPATDGGYYLIGLRAPFRDAYRQLFTEMPWSTEQVFDMTRQRIKKLGLSLAVLPARTDVDTLDDLIRLRKGLLSSGLADPEDGSLAREIDQIMMEYDRRSTA